MRKLQHVAKSGDIKEALRLLDLEKVPVDIYDSKSRTHAHTATQMAAASGKGVKMLRVLDQHGADFFVLSRTGMPLEAIAEKHKDKESVEFILLVKSRKESTKLQ